MVAGSRSQPSCMYLIFLFWSGSVLMHLQLNFTFLKPFGFISVRPSMLQDFLCKEKQSAVSGHKRSFASRRHSPSGLKYQGS